jgi:hypothetical protein
MSRETLRQKQSRFARGTALLIQFATQSGYEVTFDDAYSDWVGFTLAILPAGP